MVMSQGVFHVALRANTQDFGEGLVVVKDGCVNGGDDNFLCQCNSFPTESWAFRAEIRVSQWRKSNTHVFGGTGDFVL